MTANDRDRVAAIEARVSAATPGNWFWDNEFNLLRTDKPPLEAYPNEVEILDAWSDDDNSMPATIDVRPTDAALIANAPADIAYLLARVRETEAALAAARTAHTHTPWMEEIFAYINGRDPDILHDAIQHANAALGQRVDGEA